MNLLNPPTFHGTFWRPSKRSEERRGRVHCDDSGRITLDLVTDSTFDFEEEVAFFHGERDDGFPVTLMRCTPARSSSTIFLSSKIVFYVDFFLFGAHIKDNNCVHHIKFYSKQIDAWASTNSIRSDASSTRKVFAFSYSTPKSFPEVTVRNGVTATIKFDATCKFDQSSASITTTSPVLLSFDGDAVSIQDALRQKQIFCRFIAFCSKDSIGVHRVDLGIRGDSSGMRSVNHHPQLYYQPIEPSTNAAFRLARGNLIDFGYVRSHARSMLPRWFANYERYREAFQTYFSHLESPSTYAEYRFLPVVQALETYSRLTSTKKRYSPSEFEAISRRLLEASGKYSHWLKGILKYANEIALSQRIRELCKGFGPKIERLAELADHIAVTRNYYTHYDPRSKAAAAKGMRLAQLRAVAEVLFEVQLLRMCGLSKSRVSEVCEYSEYIRSSLEFIAQPEP